MLIKELQSRIENLEARVAVIGLGYVGLPVACEFARVGFNVVGIDIQADRIEKINAGVSPIEGKEPGLQNLLLEVIQSNRLHTTTNYDMIRECDIVLIAVETPVDQNHIPRYQALRGALESLGQVLRKNSLVIIESTISPGTMQKLVRPILEDRSGLKANYDFYLGNCPERVMPGKLLNNLRTVSRVVGGLTPETSEAMVALYKHTVEAELDPTDCITAELVKTVENTYRDVQIAFANEVAVICEAVGGDVWKVRSLVNKSPGRNMHLPGAGVGGHCIPKDPWLLAYGVKDRDLDLRVIPAARAINDLMPIHMADLLIDSLAEKRKSIFDSAILVMGYAYLENSDDTRNSPSEILVQHLRKLGAQVVIHDPFIPDYQGELLKKAEECDAAVVMVRHSAYLDLDPTTLLSILKSSIIIDGRNVYQMKDTNKESGIFKKIGKSDVRFS